MASQIYLIDAIGTTIYLTGGAGSRYTGSGTPWTVQATSPFRLALNENTGPSYTPQAPPPLDIYNGGPPFRVGADLAFRGYGNVTETFGLQLYGSTHNNAVALLRLLRRALSTALVSAPAILVVQPDGATNPVYYEVYSGIVQETASFINEEAHASEIRAVITWTRSPFGGGVSAGETLINAVTVNNTGTGTPDNLESLGTSGTGEFIYEGGPLNVRLARAAVFELLIGTVAARTYTDRSDAISTTITTEAGGPVGTAGTYSLASFVTSRRLKLRFMVRIASATANLQIRMVAGIGGSTIHTSPWQTARPGGGTGNVILDCGGAALPFMYRTSATGTHTMEWQVYVRSTDGGSATGTLDYVELIPYYTWGVLSQSIDSSFETASIETYYERTNAPALPIPVRGSWRDGNNLMQTASFRGRPPIYVSGASLYVAWRSGTTYTHTTGDTATLTATHGPLFHTLRGAG